MPLATKLDRKLRAAEESSDGEEYYEVTDRSSSESLIETGAGGEIISSGDEGADGQTSHDEAMVSNGET
jgi:ribosomal RNA-processing protein 36